MRGLPTGGSGSGPIALLNDHLHGGGTERVLSYLSGSLFAANDGLVVVFDDSQPAFDYRGRILSLGVAAPPYKGALQEGLSLLAAWRRLRRIKLRHRVRVCISQKEGPNFVNVLSGASRTVVTVHEHKSAGIRYSGIKGRMVTRLIRALYGRADRVVAVSTGIAEDLVSNFGIDRAKLEVIHNPCDREAIAARSLEPVHAGHEALFDGPTLITAGRLVTQKGQWHLVRAFARVHQQVARAKLLIIGTGDHLGYLTELASKLGVAEAVVFLGYQDNPFRYLRRADVFVLSSLWEGLGAVIQEAMACRVPVIATDCPAGPRELLAPELDPTQTCAAVTPTRYGVLTPRLNGLYKSAADPLDQGESCLADAMFQLLADKSLRQQYQARGFERAGQFGLDRYLCQWHQLLESITRERVRPDRRLSET